MTGDAQPSAVGTRRLRRACEVDRKWRVQHRVAAQLLLASRRSDAVHALGHLGPVPVVGGVGGVDVGVLLAVVIGIRGRRREEGVVVEMRLTTGVQRAAVQSRSGVEVADLLHHEEGGVRSAVADAADLAVEEARVAGGRIGWGGGGDARAHAQRCDQRRNSGDSGNRQAVPQTQMSHDFGVLLGLNDLTIGSLGVKSCKACHGGGTGSCVPGQPSWSRSPISIRPPTSWPVGGGSEGCRRGFRPGQWKPDGQREFRGTVTGIRPTVVAVVLLDQEYLGPDLVLTGVGRVGADVEHARMTRIADSGAGSRLTKRGRREGVDDEVGDIEAGTLIERNRAVVQRLLSH